MSKQRVSVPLTTAAQRRLLFETWQHTGNVTLACRAANVCRRTFYYWKPRFDAGGYAALDAFQFSVRPRPRQIADAVVEHAIALRRDHPTWGKRRIAEELAKRHGGIPPVSANTVKRLLVDAGLWTFRTPAQNLPTAPAPVVIERTNTPAPRDTAPKRGDQPVPLLATKLARPRVPATLVLRARLLDQLDSATHQRLTLVSAAAGWGKTTLLSAWAGRQPGPVAWLSLDELDNDFTRFWSAVIAALRTALPALGNTALAMLQAPEPAPAAAVVTTLLNELAAVEAPAPVALILDDVHVLDDPAVFAGVTRLIEHLPPHLHLVLASRVDPTLPLARWRVRGDLVEVRGTDLRFTVAEARTFFTCALGDELADDQVRRLAQRTEGWIAGLHLAALALRQRADRAAVVDSFTGSHRFLLDYVQEEILDRQPPQIQRFVLHAAVLRRMTADLCAAVTEEPASQALLDWLERHNLFVVPLDDTRQWYRAHDLFREVLLARLHATAPELVPQLHLRAAQWFAAHNELREAITHALIAHAYAYAAQLIERIAPELWLRGEAHTVQSWIAVLPDAVLLQHARLALNVALRLLETQLAVASEVYARTQAQVEQTVARLDAGLHRPPEPAACAPADHTPPELPPAEVALLQRRIRLLQALLAARPLITRGDMERLQHLAQETAALAADEAASWQLIAQWMAFWLVEPLQRDAALAVGWLQEAKQRLLEAGEQAGALRVIRWLACAFWRAGRPRLAHQECLHALALQAQLGEQSATTGYTQLFLACALIACNQLEAAGQAVGELMRIAHTWEHADLLINGYLTSAYLSLARGEVAAADQQLHMAEEVVRQEQFAIYVGVTAAARVAYWLAVGDVETACSWAAQVVLSPDTWNPNRRREVLALARVYLAQEQYGAALATLRRFSAELDRPGALNMTSEYLALQVVALHGSGQHADAHRVLARLLELTAPEGCIRVFVDAGEPMHRLLQRVRGVPRNSTTTLSPTATAFVTQLLIAFAQEARRVPHHAPHAPRAPLDHVATGTQPLTRREQEVLRLLLDGASNAEIANALVISLATVKKHVGNLFGKLQVANRSQVHALARTWKALA